MTRRIDEAHTGVYRRREGARTYGVPLGILTLDFNSAFIPGDIGNASTFDYPVLYRPVPGLSVAAIMADDAGAFTEKVLEAAEYLVSQGAGALTSNCGFMLRYQSEVAQQFTQVPVFLSSLLQLPLLAHQLAPQQEVFVITAEGKVLTREFLQRHLQAFPERLRVAGLETYPSFYGTMFNDDPELDASAICAEVVQSVDELVAQHGTPGAILFECAALPAYAAAVQHKYPQVPLYDFMTMINFFHDARFRTPIGGYF